MQILYSMTLEYVNVILNLATWSEAQNQNTTNSKKQFAQDICFKSSFIREKQT